MYNLPKKPKLTWKQLLKDLVEKCKNFEYIRVTDVAEFYNLPMAEASVRLKKLHGWNYLRYYNIQKKGYGGYVLTDLAFKKVKGEF